MTYLKCLLRGSILSMISDLSNENYTSALNLLRKRFDTKQVKIRTQVHKSPLYQV